MNIGIVVIAAMIFSLIIAGALIFFYFRYQNRLTAEQLRLQEQEISYQKNLIRVTIESQEEERKRIGKDLHDQVGTALSRLRLLMESLGQEQEMDEETRKRYQSSRQIISTVVSDVRTISHQLSPTILELCGLEEALLEIIDQVNTSGNLRLQLLKKQETAMNNLSAAANMAIYRSLQELITNTIKHAQAQEIRLTFQQEEHLLHICYQDDGIGLSSESEHPGMGLKNIASRIISVNGTFHIDPKATGFKINLHIPYESTN